MKAPTAFTSLFKILVFGLLFLKTGLIFSQAISSVSGLITDEQIPVNLAQVYLSNTTFVTTTNGEGRFEINNVPCGKYNLAVSSAGKLFLYPIEVTPGRIENNIQLTKRFLAGDTVRFENNPRDHADYIGAVKRYILGKSRYADRCVIINPEDIAIQYDNANRTIKARSTKPIQILNKALGYIIFVTLIDFQVNYAAGRLRFAGAPLYREVPAKSNREEMKWEKRRELCYYGSLNHFVRSLLNHDLENNHFKIYTMPKGQAPAQIDETTLLASNGNQLSLPYNLRVIYNGQLADRYFRITMPRTNVLFQQNSFVGTPYFRSASKSPPYYNDSYPGINPFQISYIYSLGADVKLYPNGYVDHKDHLMLDGYFVYKECLANALPIDYKPLKPLVRLTN